MVPYGTRGASALVVEVFPVLRSLPLQTKAGSVLSAGAGAKNVLHDSRQGDCEVSILVDLSASRQTACWTV